MTRALGSHRAHRGRDSKQRKARRSPCIRATISLEAQVTRPTLPKIPLPTSPLNPRRGGRGNLRAERKVGKMRRKGNNEWKEGAACFTALV